MDFVRGEAQKYPNVGGDYERLGALYEKKLWHQLTEELAELVNREDFVQGSNLIDLYEQFLSKFEGKLNQLKFVQIVSVIARQYLVSRPLVADEVTRGIDFLNSISEKKARLGEEAFLVLEMSKAELYIQLGSPESLKSARKLLDDAQPTLQLLEGSGAETVVNSSFYRVSCEYYKVTGAADEYYRSSIQLLSYIPVESLPEDKQKALAVDMSLAALVGETVYNYGEVLRQPILSVLDGTDYAWLHRLIKVFSAGDIDGFSSIAVNNSAAINNEPVLVKNLEILRQKVALLCLMQTIFLRPPEDRTLTLKEVAHVTKLELDHAEWLLMKAMSKGLIKGKIDQVEQLVTISWLKPRVLDKDQITTLREKLGNWTEHVGKTLLFVEEQSPELFQSHS